MVLTFKKKRKAGGPGPGRGMDAAYTPGTYSVHLNGEEVAMIVGRRRRYMESGSWEIMERYTYDRGTPRWNIGQHLFGTLKEAKRYIVRNIGRRYPRVR